MSACSSQKKIEYSERHEPGSASSARRVRPVWNGSIRETICLADDDTILTAESLTPERSPHVTMLCRKDYIKPPPSSSPASSCSFSTFKTEVQDSAVLLSSEEELDKDLEPSSQSDQENTHSSTDVSRMEVSTLEGSGHSKRRKNGPLPVDPIFEAKLKLLRPSMTEQDRVLSWKTCDQISDKDESSSDNGRRLIIQRKRITETGITRCRQTKRNVYISSSDSDVIVVSQPSTKPSGTRSRVPAEVILTSDSSVEISTAGFHTVRTNRERDKSESSAGDSARCAMRQKDCESPMIRIDYATIAEEDAEPLFKVPQTPKVVESPPGIVFKEEFYKYLGLNTRQCSAATNAPRRDSARAKRIKRRSLRVLLQRITVTEETENMQTLPASEQDANSVENIEITEPAPSERSAAEPENQTSILISRAYQKKRPLDTTVSPHLLKYTKIIKDTHKKESTLSDDENVILMIAVPEIASVRDSLPMEKFTYTDPVTEIDPDLSATVRTSLERRDYTRNKAAFPDKSIVVDKEDKPVYIKDKEINPVESVDEEKLKVVVEKKKKSRRAPPKRTRRGGSSSRRLRKLRSVKAPTIMSKRLRQGSSIRPPNRFAGFLKGHEKKPMKRHQVKAASGKRTMKHDANANISKDSRVSTEKPLYVCVKPSPDHIESSLLEPDVRDTTEVKSVDSPASTVNSRLSTDSALGHSEAQDSSAMYSPQALPTTRRCPTNPLLKQRDDRGPVIAAFFAYDILIVVQESRITFWRHSRITIVFGAPQTWTILGEIDRKQNDTEIRRPDRPCICMSKNMMPVYVEFRARQFFPDEVRRCHLASVYANIYFIVTLENANTMQMRSVQLDTINGLASDICYVALPDSRNFFLSWNEHFIDKTRTSLCKYGLTSDLEHVASMDMFQVLQQQILSLQCLEENNLIGIGESAISLWEHTTGDLIVSISLEISLGLNLASYRLAEGDDRYLFLIQMTRAEADSSDPNAVMIKMVAITLSDTITWRFLHTHKLPAGCDGLLSSSLAHSIYALTFVTGEIICLCQNSPQTLFVSRPRNTYDDPLLNTFAHNGHMIQVGDTLSVKTIPEYLLTR